MNRPILLSHLKTGKMEKCQVVAAPDNELSYTNKAILNPDDPLARFEHIAIRISHPKGDEAFVFTVISDPRVQRGQIAFNSIGRKWAMIMLNSFIEAAPYKFIPQSQCLHSITFLTDFTNRANAPSIDFDTEVMAEQFSRKFTNQAFTVGQLLAFAFEINSKRVLFELKVKEMEAVKLQQSETSASVEIGLFTANTIILFERGEGSPVNLVGGKTGQVAAPRLFNQDWDFANLGIGGLGEQFNLIFRRAFNSRLLPPQFAAEAGAEHVKGILLYGPPGTGKTLIARQIGKMLLAREPKIVNGPEVLNKFVGESEANIRKLFAEAEQEYAKVGINSGLHVIIFDEIDSICKARGNSASSAGAGDNVVNQLLTKIDGVDSLPNVLLIGMTNRRDLLDEALLRPGRLEIQIEIGLPNRQGRKEIFEIHTAKLRKKNLLDPSVDLDELAGRTKNYTGAEIAGLIKAATSLAINKVVKIGNNINIDQEALDRIKITKDDFQYAMDSDIKPALGASEDQLNTLAKPIIEWDPMIRSIRVNLAREIQQLSESSDDRPYFVLLVGKPRSGLTTIAANMAKLTRFPFVRIYRAEATAGESESFKVQYMKKLFDDASKSELSCIVMDDIELILDYCRFGPTFSKPSRAVMVASARKNLTGGRRMLVICTCSDEKSIGDLDLDMIFSNITRVPSLTKPEQVHSVMKQYQEAGDCPFTPKQCEELTDLLQSIPFEMGIYQLEKLVENARGDDPGERVRRLVERMHSLKIVQRSRQDRPFEF